MGAWRFQGGPDLHGYYYQIVKQKSDSIIKENHDPVDVAHPGINRTYDIISIFLACYEAVNRIHLQ